MNVSTAKLRQLLGNRIAEITENAAKEKVKAIQKHKADARLGIERAKKHIIACERILAAEGEAALIGAPGASQIYSQQSRGTMYTPATELRQGLKMLELCNDTSVSLAEATKLVGKSVIQALT